jgi:hypothetical protein
LHITVESAFTISFIELAENLYLGIDGDGDISGLGINNKIKNFAKPIGLWHWTIPIHSVSMLGNC